MGDMDFSAYGSGARYRRTEPDLLMASASEAKIFLCDAGETANGTPFTATLTRESLPLGGGVPGQFQVNNLWPEISASAPVSIQLGVQKRLGDVVTWKSAHDFNPQTHSHLAESCSNLADLAVTGRFVSFRLQSTSDLSWALLGLAIEHEPQGKY